MGFKISHTDRRLLKVTLHSQFTQRDLLRVNLTTIFVCNTTLFRSFPATSQRHFPQGVQQDHFRTLSRHRVYLSPTAVDRRRQMETIPGYYLEKGWVSGKVKAGGGPTAFLSWAKCIWCKAERETQHPNITPAKWGWTKKDQVIILGVLTDCEKSSTPLHLFSLSISNVKRPARICVLSVPEPGRQFAFTCRVFIT